MFLFVILLVLFYTPAACILCYYGVLWTLLSPNIDHALGRGALVLGFAAASALIYMAAIWYLNRCF